MSITLPEEQSVTRRQSHGLQCCSHWKGAGVPVNNPSNTHWFTKLGFSDIGLSWGSYLE